MEALVDVSIGANVDLVLIAGDFFDSNRVENNVVSFVTEQLLRLYAHVVILAGNHDCLVPGSIYDRTEMWKGATNVHILREPEGETLKFPGLGISVWGKPAISYGDDGAPLGGMPQPRQEGQWHVAIAHGYFCGPGGRSWASFQITAEEIIASGQDYIAMGDSHAFTCVCSEPTKAYYSGSPSYATQSVAIIDLAENTGVQVTRYPIIIPSEGDTPPIGMPFGIDAV